MYELAFHLTPDLKAAEATVHAAEVQQVVASAGGAVVSAREPRRIHLSYPIAHKHYAYFAVLDVEAPPEAVGSLDAALKLQPGILRFLAMKKPDVREVKTLGIHRFQKPRLTVARRAPEKREPTAGEQKQMEVDIEKALEKI